MEELSVDDLKQLVNYYRSRSNDLEFQVLEMTLKMNKLVTLNHNPVPATKTVVEKKQKPET